MNLSDSGDRTMKYNKEKRVTFFFVNILLPFVGLYKLQIFPWLVNITPHHMSVYYFVQYQKIMLL